MIFNRVLFIFNHQRDNKAMSWNHIHRRLNLSSCLIHLSSALGQKHRFFYSPEWESLAFIANDLLCLHLHSSAAQQRVEMTIFKHARIFIKFKIKSQSLRSITLIKKIPQFWDWDVSGLWVWIWIRISTQLHFRNRFLWFLVVMTIKKCRHELCGLKKTPDQIYHCLFFFNFWENIAQTTRSSGGNSKRIWESIDFNVSSAEAMSAVPSPFYPVSQRSPSSEAASL